MPSIETDTFSTTQAFKEKMKVGLLMAKEWFVISSMDPSEVSKYLSERYKFGKVCKKCWDVKDE